MSTREIKIIDGKKSCANCKKLLPISCFTKHARLKCGLDSYCKDCKKKARELDIVNRRVYSMESYHKHKHKHLKANRERNLRNTYNITIADYDKMFEQQGGVCAICKLPDINSRLHVDHCHDTGKVRKLLCRRCNMVLGRVEENTETLWNMIEYLKEHSEVKLERSK